MDLANKEAKKAYLLNEIPVGAILVDNTTNLLISSAYNAIVKQKNATKHVFLSQVFVTFENFQHFPNIFPASVFQ